ncbi:hypothetical protein BGZ50_003996, partial [Haplosporangium sp. Z 11]
AAKTAYSVKACLETLKSWPANEPRVQIAEMDLGNFPKDNKQAMDAVLRDLAMKSGSDWFDLQSPSATSIKSPSSLSHGRTGSISSARSASPSPRNSMSSDFTTVTYVDGLPMVHTINEIPPTPDTENGPTNPNAAGSITSGSMTPEPIPVFISSKSSPGSVSGSVAGDLDPDAIARSFPAFDMASIAAAASAVNPSPFVPQSTYKPSTTYQVGHGQGGGVSPTYQAGPGQGDRISPAYQAGHGQGQGDRVSPAYQAGPGQGDRVSPAYQAGHGSGQGDRVSPAYQAGHGPGQGDRVSPAYQAGHGQGDRVSPAFQAGHGQGGRVSPAYQAGHEQGGRASPTYQAGHGQGGRVSPTPPRRTRPLSGEHFSPTYAPHPLMSQQVPFHQQQRQNYRPGFRIPADGEDENIDPSEHGYDGPPPDYAEAAMQPPAELRDEKGKR